MRRTGIRIWAVLLLFPQAGGLGARWKANASDRQCWKVALSGQVDAGRQWSASLGQGWAFKVMPIAASAKGYTGWDLVVDREADGGYPDALLLGTPPYGSLNEREIGTTFGLRAQDAIAWQPRRFHFLTSARDLAKGRELFGELMQAATGQRHESAHAAADLLKLVSTEPGLGAGEFRILDAKLTPGQGDPPEYAQQWAGRLRSVPHTNVAQSGDGSPKGQLRWIQFVLTLWLPIRQLVPPGSKAELTSCAE